MQGRNPIDHSGDIGEKFQEVVIGRRFLSYPGVQHNSITYEMLPEWIRYIPRDPGSWKQHERAFAEHELMRYLVSSLNPPAIPHGLSRGPMTKNEEDLIEEDQVARIGLLRRPIPVMKPQPSQFNQFIDNFRHPTPPKPIH